MRLHVGAAPRHNHYGCWNLPPEHFVCAVSLLSSRMRSWDIRSRDHRDWRASAGGTDCATTSTADQAKLRFLDGFSGVTVALHSSADEGRSGRAPQGEARCTVKEQAGGLDALTDQAAQIAAQVELHPRHPLVPHPLQRSGNLHLPPAGPPVNPPLRTECTAEEAAGFCTASMPHQASASC